MGSLYYKFLILYLTVIIIHNYSLLLLSTKYKKIFRVILTDNGSEFFNPYEMEYDYNTGKKVTNVFYCHPYASYEKHELEVNHEYIRRVFPKGFNSITTEMVNKLRDNINAIPRNSINGNTPYDLT